MGKETGKAKKTPTKPAASSKGAARKTVGRPFKPGQSGNPTGGKKIPEDVKQAFRALTPQAVATLFGIMTEGEQESNRLRAAETILNRAWGTPTQAVEVTGSEGSPLVVSIRYVD
jgi:hypothetical protein